MPISVMQRTRAIGSCFRYAQKFVVFRILIATGRTDSGAHLMILNHHSALIWRCNFLMDDRAPPPVVYRPKIFPLKTSTKYQGGLINEPVGRLA